MFLVLGKTLRFPGAITKPIVSRFFLAIYFLRKLSFKGSFLTPQQVQVRPFFNVHERWVQVQFYKSPWWFQFPFPTISIRLRVKHKGCMDGLPCWEFLGAMAVPCRCSSNCTFAHWVPSPGVPRQPRGGLLQPYNLSRRIWLRLPSTSVLLGGVFLRHLLVQHLPGEACSWAASHTKNKHLARCPLEVRLKPHGLALD